MVSFFHVIKDRLSGCRTKDTHSSFENRCPDLWHSMAHQVGETGSNSRVDGVAKAEAPLQRQGTANSAKLCRKRPPLFVCELYHTALTWQPQHPTARSLDAFASPAIRHQELPVRTSLRVWAFRAMFRVKRAPKEGLQRFYVFYVVHSILL